MKTSILIPGDTQGTATFYIKVCDGQNNEGSNVPYTITASTTPVAGAPASIAATAGQPLLYYNEADENPNPTESNGVNLEIFSNLKPYFDFNTEWLDFRNDAATGISKTTQADGSTTITFPWISGYIDYQGDRDFFQLDFGKLGNGPETSWYYDVQIRLVVPSPGSQVEYVWKLYRDRNGNRIVMDDPTSPDGYKACNGDTTPQAVEALDLATPAPGTDETFWIGSEWGGEANAKFYLAISDFNYLKLPGTEENNSQADDDWGYDAPYYFTLTLTYHPGQAQP